MSVPLVMCLLCGKEEKHQNSSFLIGEDINWTHIEMKWWETWGSSLHKDLLSFISLHARTHFSLMVYIGQKRLGFHTPMLFVIVKSFQKNFEFLFYSYLKHITIMKEKIVKFWESRPWSFGIKWSQHVNSFIYSSKTLSWSKVNTSEAWVGHHNDYGDDD